MRNLKVVGGLVPRHVRAIDSAKLLIFFCTIGLLSGGTSPSIGATLKVPQQYPTIQSAIDAAVDGDTVQVAVGTYRELLIWRSKAISLIGAGADVTIVDASGSGRCLTMENVPESARVEGFTFTRGQVKRGGGLYLWQSAPTLTNNIIQGNRAYAWTDLPTLGGGIALSNSSPTLINNTIRDNGADLGLGGGLHLYCSSPILTNNTIHGNSANFGCGLYIDQSSPTLTNNTITSNSSSRCDEGGGLYLCRSLPMLIGNTISGNSANGGGSALYLDWSSPTLMDNTIERNSGGGHALSLWHASPTLTNNTIQDNVGGGLFLSSTSSATLMNNIIQRNSARYGGGLFLLGYSSATLDNNTIANNSAIEAGGGLGADNSSPKLTNNIIKGNSASRGGGLLLGQCSGAVTGNTIQGNSASVGGGLFVDFQSSTTLMSNSITGNSASSYGGGLYYGYSSGQLANNVIAANSASSYGGGVYYRNSSGQVVNNVIVANSGSYGAGLYYDRSSGELVGNVIAGNSSSYGGGVYLEYSSPKLTNNTIASNTGGGVYTHCSWPWGVVITNCILWANSGGLDLTEATVSFSDIGTGNIAGNGNISIDPMFVDPATGDFHLKDGSPCIDKGTNTAPALPVADKDGNPRIVGAAVDMGAYEWQGPSNRPPVAEAGPDQTVEQTSQAGAEVTLDGSACIDPDNDPLTYTWKEGDTIVAGPITDAEVRAILQLGTHAITLTVADGEGGTDSDEVVVDIQDTTPPEITAPAELEAEQTSRDGTPVDLGKPEVSDICDANPTVTNDAPAVFPLGETLVTWTATDGSGNKATAAQKASVKDTTEPTVSINAVEPEIEQETSGGTVVTLEGSAEDICDAELELTWKVDGLILGEAHLPVLEREFQLGEHTATLMAKDDSGNVGEATVTLEVVDTTPPFIIAPPDVVVEQTDRAGTVVDLGNAQVSDNCDMDPEVANDAPPDSKFPLGETIATWTATDDSGNRATAQQRVTIIDTTPPMVNAGPDLEFIEGETVVLVTPKVSDICDMNPQLSDDRPAQFPVGQTTVTFTATDASGNVGADSIVVTIKRAQQAISDLKQVVNGLPLSGGEKNSLTAKLDAATKSLDKAQETAAINQLNAFINEVRALERSGRLNSEAAPDLIARAQRIIAAIQGARKRQQVLSLTTTGIHELQCRADMHSGVTLHDPQECRDARRTVRSIEQGTATARILPFFDQRDALTSPSRPSSITSAPPPSRRKYIRRGNGVNRCGGSHV